MKKFCFSIVVLSLISCNKLKESTQDALTNSMEKAIESKTGTQVDLPDAADMENNGAFVNYKVADKVYLKSERSSASCRLGLTTSSVPSARRPCASAA